ncbi:MAG: restriction endonuclease subunit S [Anaerolineales bacterium]|nr:restriction endonuclease subunit S [Anaerolineales bacterium]
MSKLVNGKWRNMKLGDVAEIKNGSTPSTKREEYYDGDIIWITPKDLSRQNARYIYKGERNISEEGYKSCSTTIVPKGTVLLSSRAPIGLLSIAGVNLCTNQGFKNIVPHKGKINSEFLFYYLKTKIADIEKLGSGTTFKEVSKSSLERFSILIPEKISDQQKIADVLSALDAKIELNARVNAELESLAKTIYDYWFVQFKYPTPSVLRTSPPNATEVPSNLGEVPAMAGGGGLVWNEELKREIPLGWEVGELGNFAQPIRGVTYKKDDIKKSSDKNAIPILRATNITNGVIDLNDMVYVPKEAVSEEQFLNKFDVLITMSSGSKAHVGKNAFYYFDQKVSFGAFCSKLSVNKNMRFYVNTQMQSDSFKKYIANVGLGTNINNLTNKHITEYKLLIPPKELLLQYENIVEGFYNRIGNNMKESQALTELRDWLLPLLMNGQVKV